jgi:hypothetical protein
MQSAVLPSASAESGSGGGVSGYISLKWRLTVKVLPFVAAVVLAKFLAHLFELEYFAMSVLFGAFISANVFLIGFLLSGVLTDYKESERLPGELACCLETIADEGQIIYMNNKSSGSQEIVEDIGGLVASILAWFHKQERSSTLFSRIAALNPHFLALERHTAAPFVARLKTEQNNIRRIIVRIHTIRETSFNPSAYAIAEIMSAALSLGLVLTRMDPFYESIFFVAVISFVQIYMVMLIRDLDNPFSYYAAGTLSENISLKPLYDLQKRVKAPIPLEPVAIVNQPKTEVSGIAVANAGAEAGAGKSKWRR